MRNLIRLVLWTLLAATLVASPAHAYPISPVPLWELVVDSDLVVVAQVDGVREKEKQEDDIFPFSIARLVVHETWKGESLQTVEVVFPAGLICPAPPRYLDKKTVVAFLAKDDGSWSTVALSYGTLYPTGSEIDDLRIMVRSARALLEDGASPAEKTDWLVEAAARPGTRWHGLYEILPAADQLHSYYDGNTRTAESDLLTRDQLARIAAGFAASPSTDRTLPMALAVLAPYRSDSVSRASVAAIEALVAQEEVPWWIPDALVAVLERYGDRNAKARVATLGGDFDERDAKRVRELWERAKAELGIPKVAPAPLRDQEVWGTGENTPS